MKDDLSRATMATNLKMTVVLKGILNALRKNHYTLPLSPTDIQMKLDKQRSQKYVSRHNLPYQESIELYSTGDRFLFLERGFTAERLEIIPKE